MRLVQQQVDKDMTVFDVRLHGGSVVRDDGTVVVCDVYVRNGSIAEYGDSNRPLPAKETVDCRGLHLLPGVVDPHVHLGADATYARTERDVGLESIAAAAGGVTTMLVYALTDKPYSSFVKELIDLMGRKSLIDFGLHFCLSTQVQLDEIERYVMEFGVSSFKVFMNFQKDEGRFLGVQGTGDDFLVKLLDNAAKLGVTVAAHCESSGLNDAAASISGLESQDLRSLSANKPPFSEAAAVAKLGYVSYGLGAQAYAVHVSSELGMEAARAVKKVNPRFYVETCPQYLTLDVDSSRGSFAKTSPPLRSSEDRDALWRGIEDGTIDTIGSDHVARARSAKDKSFSEASAGIPGVQTLLPLLLSEGHHKRGLPLGRIAEITSASSAKIFGLYPRKGSLRVGADADVVFVDLEREEELSDDQQYSYAGFMPWSGEKIRGVVQRTMVRGKVVYDRSDRSTTADLGHGAFLRRTVAPVRADLLEE